MQIITRTDQNILARGPSYLQLNDGYFDGITLPRTIRPRTWIPEATVHRGKILSTQIDSTRYFMGPQNCVVRDDNRRITWVAFVETPSGKEGLPRFMLHKLPGSWPSSRLAPPPESMCLAEDNIWRYHIALNKFTGKITAVWVTRSDHGHKLWFDGTVVETQAQEPDFPFYALSQPPIGHVASEEPPFGILGYKCRKSHRIFIRRVEADTLGPEVELKVGNVLGGITFAISRSNVIARMDLLNNDNLVPAIMTSADSGKTFGEVKPIDVSEYERGFKVVPGYTEPVVDVGGHFHAPIHVSDGKESKALNYIVRDDVLTEAIRVNGSSQISKHSLENVAISQGAQEVFPATLGNPAAYGNGVTDGHGLIMVISTEGRLFSSNSSAGGRYYPEPALLNYEMPLIHVFASTECYTGGLRPNFVSMDYIYIEADAEGRPVSSDLHMETWDMPLPIPQVEAIAKGPQVEIRSVADMDFEPGQVSFSFTDPSIRITDVKVTSLRTAVVNTNAESLKGQAVRIDVDSLFHRHYAEAVVR